MTYIKMIKKCRFATLTAILLAVAVFVAVLNLSLVSCANGGTANNSEGGVSFTDALGRKITVPKNPGRVAALIGSFADIWMLSGGTLCAAAEDAWEDFGLEIDGVNIGGAHSPSAELLLSASPDFVIASASTSSNLEMMDMLTAAGITVAYFDVDNFEDYLRMLDICTDITGRKDLYEKNGLVLAEQINEIKASLGEANVPERERRVLLLRASSATVKAKGSEGTVLGEMLHDLGCVNIADTDRSLLENLSVESVIRENPYRIFVVTMGGNTEAAEKSVESMMEENPAWGNLEAVREGRLHVMEKSLFNLKPNARFPEAYRELYDILTKKQ